MNSPCHTQNICLLPPPFFPQSGREGYVKTYSSAEQNIHHTELTHPTAGRYQIQYGFSPKCSSFFLDAKGVISGIMKILQISSHDLFDIQTLMNSSHTRLLILRRKFHVPFPQWQTNYGLFTAMIKHSLQIHWHTSHLFLIQNRLTFFWHDPFQLNNGPCQNKLLEAVLYHISLVSQVPVPRITQLRTQAQRKIMLQKSITPKSANVKDIARNNGQGTLEP